MGSGAGVFCQVLMGMTIGLYGSSRGIVFSCSTDTGKGALLGNGTLFSIVCSNFALPPLCCHGLVGSPGVPTPDSWLHTMWSLGNTCGISTWWC